MICQAIFFSHAWGSRFALKPKIEVIARKGCEALEQRLVLLQAELFLGVGDGVCTTRSTFLLYSWGRLQSRLAEGLEAHFLAEPKLLVECGVDTAVIFVSVGLLAADQRYE
ncbi:MAG: hypothetical protein R6X02_20380 [Enhygromyxa sp.]